MGLIIVLGLMVTIASIDVFVHVNKMEKAVINRFILAMSKDPHIDSITTNTSIGHGELFIDRCLKDFTEWERKVIKNRIKKGTLVDRSILHAANVSVEDFYIVKFIFSAKWLRENN